MAPLIENNQNQKKDNQNFLLVSIFIVFSVATFFGFQIWEGDNNRKIFSSLKKSKTPTIVDDDYDDVLLTIKLFFLVLSIVLLILLVSKVFIKKKPLKTFPFFEESKINENTFEYSINYLFSFYQQIPHYKEIFTVELITCEDFKNLEKQLVILFEKSSEEAKKSTLNSLNDLVEMCKKFLENAKRRDVDNKEVDNNYQLNNYQLNQLKYLKVNNRINSDNSFNNFSINNINIKNKRSKASSRYKNNNNNINNFNNFNLNFNNNSFDNYNNSSRGMDAENFN